MTNLRPIVYTIGHSLHSFKEFVVLLKQHGVTALCDVRSKPYSRMNPQFNRENLKPALREHGIAYVFLGRELGARSEDPSCYVHGKVQYDRLARSPLFQNGLDRVRDGMKDFRLALMCAEKDPLACHRTILIARQLVKLGIEVEHILYDGTLETHEDALNQLLDRLSLSEKDMFRSRDDAIEEAYRMQAERIAYDESETPHGEAESVGTISE